MAFARVGKDDLRWTRGTPRCVPQFEPGRTRISAAPAGRRLTYHFIEQPYISVTVGSLDDPEAAQPALQYCVDRELSWFATIRGLPRKRTDEFITPELAARFVNHQHPDHDT